jgi:sporulation integral membrane protein YtvI
LKTGDTGLIRSKLMITIILTTIGVYLSFQYLLPLIFPFVAAYFLSWIVRPAAEFMNRKFKMPRILAGLLSLLIFTGILGAGICLLINNLFRQLAVLLRNMPIYLNYMLNKLEIVCYNFDGWFGLNQGTFKKFADDNMTQTLKRIKINILPKITEKTVLFAIQMAGAIGVILIILIAAILIIKDLPKMKKCFEEHELYHDIHKVTQKLTDAGIAYIRSQLIILLIVSVFCVFGFTLIKNEYALLLGIGIAIVDALPIIGSGIFLIPWSIIMLLNGNIYAAAVLITTYLFCQITREVLEPKLIGKCIGVTPLFTLMAMYIGIKLFSIVGFVLGPIGLVIIVTTVKVVREKVEEKVAE